MEITSYLLGKKSGGTTPTGTINITENGQHNVSGYAVADVNVVPSGTINITQNGTHDVSNYASANVNVPSVPDWSTIGYSNAPQSIIDDYNYSKNIYDNWENVANLSSKFQYNTMLSIMPLVDTSNATNMRAMLNGCTSLKTIPLLNTSNVASFSNFCSNCPVIKTFPQLDTSNATDMGFMLQGCTKLTTIPQLDTSKCTTLRNIINATPNLTNTSLDNILKMCIGVPNTYPREKTFKDLVGSTGTSKYSVERIQALPSYQDFIDAGWTIGY